MTQEILTAIVLSILFGLLVGIQRERSDADRMGVRTFTLLTLFGTVCGVLSSQLGVWLIGVGLLVTLGLVALGWLLRNPMRNPTSMDILDVPTSATATTPAAKMTPVTPATASSSEDSLVTESLTTKSATSVFPIGPHPEHRHGLTTEVSAVMMFCVGAMLAIGHLEFAIVVGGLVAILLQSKVRLHTFAARLGEEDVRAIMTFILVSCIVLPVLPNRTFGPFDVLNPREIWFFVVLIVGLNLTGYLAYRFYGERTGIWLGGIMGGLVSSTATTVSWSRSSRESARLMEAAIVVILVATAISFFRVIVLIGAVSMDLAGAVAIPIGTLGGTCLVESLWMARRYLGHAARSSNDSIREPYAMAAETSQLRNPTQIRVALTFAAMYAVILFVTAAVLHRANASSGGPIELVVAMISGFTDMDAIALSTARLVRGTGTQLGTSGGMLMILAATCGSLIFKLGIAGFLGGRRFVVRLGLWYILPLIAAMVVTAITMSSP